MHAREDQAAVQAMDHDGHAQGCHGFVGSVVRDAQLFGYSVGWGFQFKEFDEPEPLLAGKMPIVEKTQAKVMERIATTAAAAVVAPDGVETAVPAFGAKTLMVFPTKTQQIFSCRFFIFYNLFVLFKFHEGGFLGKNLSIVPIFLLECIGVVSGYL
jgi:hypothetical protein